MDFSHTEKFLEIAQSIGAKLCNEVIWYDSRCNWIGRSLDDIIEKGIPSCKALSSEMYEGTSGIAIFLANLYICGNKKIDKYRQTAEGALNQALSRVDDIPQISRFGLYSGKIGIAYATAVIGKQFDNQNLIENSLQIVKKLDKDKKEEHLLDIISGTAGAIPSLLKIHEITDEEQVLNLAIELGRELISSAVKEPYGWSWDSKSSGSGLTSHNLTGFSHGAAGIGYALLELYNKTNNEEFYESAKQAVRYENHWFNKQENNWPDFRIDERNPTGTQEKEKPKFMAAWCHGAPGISLSRLRAYQILKDEMYLQDIQAAVKSITNIVNGFDTNNQWQNFTLCHGLSGIGEILLYAGKILDNDTYKSMAIQIGRYGIEQYVNQNLSWPCDNRVDEMLGLMIGITGIGNFYLHLCYPDKMSSPLIIEFNTAK